MIVGRRSVNVRIVIPDIRLERAMVVGARMACERSEKCGSRRRAAGAGRLRVRCARLRRESGPKRQSPQCAITEGLRVPMGLWVFGGAGGLVQR